jgi:protein tyrosine/serine phosphatase
MPTEEALRELKAFGVSLILDLREDGSRELHEKQEVEKLGMRYEHIPLSGYSAPSRQNIARALKLLLDGSSAKIYVHCLRGKDRTGTVIACYRIQHDGWNNQRALAEAKSYGMSSLEVAMRSFIQHFSPLKLP